MDRETIKRLAASPEAETLMALLKGQEGLGRAARAAAEGDTAGLKAMLESLTRTEQGERAIRDLEDRVRQAGLGQD